MKLPNGLVAMVAMALSAATAAGQTAAPKNVLSIQPLSAIFQVYSREYERAAGKAVTWGLGATLFRIGGSSNDVNYTSAEFKLRYYPAEIALQGFSVGGAVGLTSVNGTSDTGRDQTVTGPSVGVLLEYQWLMGTSKNFALTLGLGAKALSIKDNFSSSDFIARYPTARVSVGYSF